MTRFVTLLPGTLVHVMDADKLGVACKLKPMADAGQLSSMFPPVRAMDKVGVTSAWPNPLKTAFVTVPAL